ncbi:MAG: hypothetical protein IPN43_17025 [Chitinophagaceae bacterium]|nr:hypothetical protein [Chitinophagaceae bacterium]
MNLIGYGLAKDETVAYTKRKAEVLTKLEESFKDIMPVLIRNYLTP